MAGGQGLRRGAALVAGHRAEAAGESQEPCELPVTAPVLQFTKGPRERVSQR